MLKIPKGIYALCNTPVEPTTLSQEALKECLAGASAGILQHGQTLYHVLSNTETITVELISAEKGSNKHQQIFELKARIQDNISYAAYAELKLIKSLTDHERRFVSNPELNQLLTLLESVYGSENKKYPSYMQKMDNFRDPLSNQHHANTKMNPGH